MTNPPAWMFQVNNPQAAAPQRPGWRVETVELLQAIAAACHKLREGLSAGAAQQLAQAVYATANYAAVSVSNWQERLAFVGSSSESEPPHFDRLCPAFQLALETGKFQTCGREPETSRFSNCWALPLEQVSADDLALRWLAVVPLANEEEVIGVLTVYASDLSPLNAALIELAQWVGLQAGLNLELRRLRGSAGQVAAAELKALRAQISPHFLFNTLNTIAALIRLDAEQARDLLVDFASFFRRTLKYHGEFVSLAEELDYVAHYVRFESVRFGSNLVVSYDLAPTTETVSFPLLTVQPLVENAIRHGIAQKIGSGQVWIKTRTVSDGDVEITVADDGVGIAPEILSRLKTGSAPGKGLGMALNNINARLQKIFGPTYQLHIESTFEGGTKVSFRVPRIRKS